MFELAKAMSIVEPPPFRLNVRSLPVFRSTISRTLSDSKRIFPLVFVRGQPHSVAQALKSPAISTLSLFSKSDTSLAIMTLKSSSDCYLLGSVILDLFSSLGCSVVMAVGGLFPPSECLRQVIQDQFGSLVTTLIIATVEIVEVDEESVQHKALHKTTIPSNKRTSKERGKSRIYSMEVLKKI
ncbi:hypothetical protein FF38_05483 [Lucilia cuprina]|uniref:Uncharacterized protein n=1 Tax=Lucilia cuprina TaxID=7375 RepID=A0A0L0C697_LUCCU|nr:hypothetical protein FF38_05483 [Lucilia cuprina]